MKSLPARQQQELQHKEHSKGLIAILTDAQQSREFERSLTIKKIVEHSLPITEMHRHVGAKAIAIAIDTALTRLVASLNLKWNISDNQVKNIVEDLMDKYENESIEDFVLCFKKARLGEYGKIIRLDGAILCEWMALYLDDKYKHVEQKLIQERDNMYEAPSVLNDEPGYNEFKKWAKEFVSGAKVPMISDEEIRRNGQEQPPKKKAISYHSSPPEVSAMIDLKSQYGRECTDKVTGKVLPGMPKFEDWLKEQQ